MRRSPIKSFTASILPATWRPWRRLALPVGEPRVHALVAEQHRDDRCVPFMGRRNERRQPWSLLMSGSTRSSLRNT